MKALILAAGKGTRLKELTADKPKPMIEIGGEPLLAHHVRRLRAAGVREIAINLHHAPSVITDYFGDGSRYGVQIEYSYEPELLGTAGAAKKLQAFLDEPFFVIYGDVFNNVDLDALAAFHAEGKESARADTALTMSLYRVPNPTECGLVEITPGGRVTRFVEKPPPAEVFTDLANAGLLVCDASVLAYVPPTAVYDFGRDLIPELLAQEVAVFGKPVTDAEHVIDIGTLPGLARAQALIELSSTPPVSA
jgi:NDP-sugar pyrophosphorylase family protein